MAYSPISVWPCRLETLSPAWNALPYHSNGSLAFNANLREDHLISSSLLVTIPSLYFNIFCPIPNIILQMNLLKGHRKYIHEKAAKEQPAQWPPHTTLPLAPSPEGKNTAFLKDNDLVTTLTTTAPSTVQCKLIKGSLPFFTSLLAALSKGNIYFLGCVPFSAAVESSHTYSVSTQFSKFFLLFSDHSSIFLIRFSFSSAIPMASFSNIFSIYILFHFIHPQCQIPAFIQMMPKSNFDPSPKPQTIFK